MPLDGLVQGWVENDVESLEAFLEDLPPGEDWNQLDASRWRYLTVKDPMVAADKALAIADPDKQTEMLNRVLLYWWQEPRSAIEWLEKVEVGPAKETWLDRLIGSLAHRDPAEAFEESMKRLEGAQQKSTLQRVMEPWADLDPESAFKALLALPATVRDEHIIEALGCGLTDPSFVDPFLHQLSQDADRSAFVGGLARFCRSASRNGDYPENRWSIPGLALGRRSGAGNQGGGAAGRGAPPGLRDEARKLSCVLRAPVMEM